MITVRGLSALKAKIARMQATVEIHVARAVEIRISNMFSELVAITPQYTGNLASNWFIDVGSDPSYNPIALYRPPERWEKLADPYQMGSDPAVSLATGRELRKLRDLRRLIFLQGLRTIRLVNTAPYASEVEVGIGPRNRLLREVNLRDKYGLNIMKSYIVVKYGKLKYGA
jgi:hypothetical protein